MFCTVYLSLNPVHLPRQKQVSSVSFCLFRIICKQTNQALCTSQLVVIRKYTNVSGGDGFDIFSKDYIG